MDGKELIQDVEAVAKAAVATPTRRHWVYIIIAVVAALTLGGAVGRLLFPRVETKVEIQTKVQTKVETVIQYKDRIVEKVVYVKAEKTHESTTTTETKKPDGTTVTETHTDKDTSADTSTKTDTDTTHEGTETKTVVQVVEKVVEKEKIVNLQPSWALHAGVGISIPYYLEGPAAEIGIPGMKGVVIQAGADRHVVGPLWLGIFGNTQGTAGVDLRAEW